MIILFLLFVLAVGCAGFYYLLTRFRRFSFLNRLARGEKKRVTLFAALCVLALCLPLLIWTFAAMTVILHLIIFWFLCDLIFNGIAKLRKRIFLRYYAGAAAFFVTAVYLCFGWYFSHHVYRTDYALQTQKSVPSVRVVLLADSHLGEIMSGETFAEQLQSIQETAPDVVVISGDFVDDDTSKEDLMTACSALRELKTTYGVYFVFGNHDKGYFRSRDFTEEDLRTALSESNVTILEDEVVLLGESIYLVGRQDSTVKDRAEISALTADLDPSKYTIVLNHQPNDYENEAQANVDLVLSGHTHGGHIFPLGVIGYILGANDQVYGIEQRNGTDFIVTSGICGWGVPFKTGAISEYVVIDITSKAT